MKAMTTFIDDTKKKDENDTNKKRINKKNIFR